MGSRGWIYAERLDQGSWRLAEEMESNPDHEFDPIGEPAMYPREAIEPLWTRATDVLMGTDFSWFSTRPVRGVATRRGLPADVSPELRVWSDWMEATAPGTSWLTLRELQEFDWHGREVTWTSMVPREAAGLFGSGPWRWWRKPRRGFPTPAEWPPGLRMSHAAYSVDGVTVRWTESYAEAVGCRFYPELLDRLATFGSPDHVRIVMFRI